MAVYSILNRASLHQTTDSSTGDSAWHVFLHSWSRLRRSQDTAGSSAKYT